MMPERRLVVALSGTAEDAPLMRYAAAVAALNARAAARIAVAPGPDAAPLALCGENGRAVAVSGASGLRFVQVVSRKEGAPSQEGVQVRVKTCLPPDLSLPADVEVHCGRAANTFLTLSAADTTDAVLVGDGPGGRELAMRLVREAASSVWSVPSGASTRFLRILVPVDFSARAADSLRVATTLGHLAGDAECVALHVHFDDCLVERPGAERDRLAQLDANYVHFMQRV